MKRRVLLNIDRRSFYIALLLLFFFTVAVLPMLAAVVNGARQYPATRIEHALLQGIEADKQFAAQQVAALSALPSLRQAIAESNQLEAASILSDEAVARGLNSAVAVNAAGVAVARFPFVSNRGDVVAQTTPWGRAAAEGKATVQIGVGRSFPLIITAAQPLFAETNVVTGAIYGGFLLNDGYAQRLHDKYLSTKPNVRLVIYSEEVGVVGTTFTDPDTKSLLSTNFNSGTDFVQQGLSRHLVRIGSKEYTVRNITFHDADQKLIGGMLVLIPRDQTYQRIAIALILTVLFLVCFLHVRGKPLHSMSVTRWLLVLGVAAVSYSVAMVFYRAYLPQQVVDITQPDQTIYNSVLGFAPNSEVIDGSSTKQIAVRLASGGEPINAVQIALSFNPKVISVQDISISNSLCQKDLMTEKAINNSLGTVTFGCGLPTPGFGYGIGTVADLVVKAVGRGESAIVFDEVNTRVLANDGLGTDVLRTTAPAHIRVVDAESLLSGAVANPAATEDGAPAAPAVFSQSHPNSALWVANRSLTFNWPRVAGVEYLYALDQSPTSSVAAATVINSSTFEVTVDSDGVYYFHLFARKNGKVSLPSVYKVQVDTVAPNAPEILASETSIAAGATVRFKFSSQDATSGLQEKFYSKVYLDGKEEGIRLPAGNEPSVVFPHSGRYVVEVRAFDNAGNFSDASTTITVRADSFIRRVLDFFSAVFRS